MEIQHDLQLVCRIFCCTCSAASSALVMEFCTCTMKTCSSDAHCRLIIFSSGVSSLTERSIFFCRSWTSASVFSSIWPASRKFWRSFFAPGNAFPTLSRFKMVRVRVHDPPIQLLTIYSTIIFQANYLFPPFGCPVSTVLFYGNRLRRLLNEGIHSRLLTRHRKEETRGSLKTNDATQLPKTA